MKRRTVVKLILYVCGALIIVVTLFPVVWAALTSLKTTKEILVYPPSFLPNPVTIVNYGMMLIGSQYGFFAVNSVIVGMASTLVVIIVSILSGYGYSKFFSFRGKSSFMIFIIIARMVPGIAIVIPLFLLIQSVGLYDTRLGLVVVYSAMALPLAIWLLKTFFDEFPRSIVDAGRIDGCGIMGILTRIILPISGPSIASATTITFLTVWNTFLIALVLTKTPDSETLPVAISELAHAEFGVNWGGLSAIAMITVIPVFIVGLVSQKYLTRGLTAGAEKG